MASKDGALVDTDVMRKGAQTITDTGQNITGVNQKVDATMQSLFSTWRADSANVFSGAMGQFDQTVRKIVQKLDELSQNVQASASQYDAQDQDNTSNANNNAAIIGGGGLQGF
ncbi:WXG100 family type VII secretion target [Amycolatopsis jiangsuensis]|uniref:WXG100 family type VII secretion target n=1 Tax=Amycolatopsis jiangsuensis TaxID=1181879 RepID=A0A840IXM9_9PSEU|nr:WXG100 family type VII secretion target [Amycolatopsis jiangsuensis]MBB4687591.1 WXG100 family type VII secretion target [Amycolatopsis jiangsuensis]